jgi:hypothetical protein
VVVESAIMPLIPRPKRHARAEVRIERNELSDRKKFVRITIWAADSRDNPEVKQQFSLDEGTAFQLGTHLQVCLEQLDRERGKR